MTTWAIACLCPVFPPLPGSLGAPADGASEQVRLQRAAQGLQPVSSLRAASVPVPVTPTLPLGCNSTSCAQLGAQLTTAFAGKNQPAEISPLAGSRSFVMLLSVTVINPHLLCQLLPWKAFLNRAQVPGSFFPLDNGCLLPAVPLHI